MVRAGGTPASPKPGHGLLHLTRPLKLQRRPKDFSGWGGGEAGTKGTCHQSPPVHKKRGKCFWVLPGGSLDEVFVGR